jgi:hypothetical protein
MYSENSFFKPKSDTPKETKLGYFKATKKASYSLLASLPLLMGYEILIRVEKSTIINGMANWVQEFADLVGFWGSIVMGVLVVALCIFTVQKDRKQGIKIKKAYLLGMTLESILYAFILAPLVTFVFFGQKLIIFESEPGIITQFALCLGAGFYEEFFFRFLFIGFPFVLLDNMYPEKKMFLPKFFIFMISAAIFSYVHYTGAGGDIFTWKSFIFRMGAGIVLGIIFLLRGFGVAAWTHAIYDILIVFGILKLITG